MDKNGIFAHMYTPLFRIGIAAIIGLTIYSCGTSEEVVVSLDGATEILYCEGRGDRIYHISSECKKLKKCGNLQKIEKEEVRKHGLAPCNACVK